MFFTLDSLLGRVPGLQIWRVRVRILTYAGKHIRSTIKIEAWLQRITSMNVPCSTLVGTLTRSLSIRSATRCHCATSAYILAHQQYNT